MNRQSNMEKWAALYVRLSRDDENEGDSNSISHQIELLQRYCKERSITNCRVYKDGPVIIGLNQANPCGTRGTLV